MRGDAPALLVDPVVGWPREAEAGRSYLVTVDLDGPSTAEGWPYEEEEFDFGIALDGAPHFVCRALGEPSVVLHRFGGTYGPARFVVTAREALGPGSLWLTITNRWGTPVRTVELPSRVVQLVMSTGPDIVVPSTNGRPATVHSRGLPASRSPAVWSPDHITISFAGTHQAWATWVRHQLERHGCRTALLRWDPAPGVPLGEPLTGLLAAPGRILLLLDEEYLRLGRHTEDEWTEALTEVVRAHRDRFTAVDLSTGTLPDSTALLGPPSLTDLDPEEALRRLLTVLGLEHAPPDDEETAVAPRFPDAPPAVWNVPGRNLCFTGRNPVLEELHELFESGGPGGARVALRGISGVGKSQIVTEYAHRFANEYDVVWWISAGFPATARQQFADLADRLRLTNARSLGERVRAVRESLRTGRPHGRWLLILDSADAMDEVDDLLPESGGHVAITTLIRGWAASGRLVGEIEVERFTRPESIGYARRHVERLTETEADQLADAVEDFPLLLAQTAAWLDANHQVPAAEYIARLRGADAADITIQTLPDYPMGFQTSWALTLSSLERDSPEATELLRLFTMFSPGSIPVRQLQQAGADDLPPRLAELAADPAQWRMALTRLSESTAVRMDYMQTSDSETHVDSVEMHRLYHRFLRRTLSPTDRDKLSAAACRVLVSADPEQPSDVRTWPTYAGLLPHLYPSGALESAEDSVRELVLNCIEYLRLRDEESTGLTLCEQVLARWRVRLPPTHPSMLVLVHQHADMLRRCGRYREAEAVDRAAVEQLADERPAEDADLLRAKASLGGSLMALGLFGEARQLFQQVWRAYDAQEGPEAFRTQDSLHNLGLALGLLGRNLEAAAVHGELLALRERLLRPNHQLTLLSGLTYARSLRLLGRHEEATELQNTNTRLHRQTMGNYHPQTLSAVHNMALCLPGSGDVSGAGDMLRVLLERCQQLLGARHPMTLMVQSDHASLLRSHGDPGESAELTRQVVEGYRHLLGDDHPNTLGVLGNLGLVYWRLGNHDDARNLIEQSLRGMRTAVGADHPWSLGCALNVAAVRHLSGRQEEAAALREDTLRRARQVVDEGHPLLLACTQALTTAADDPPDSDFEPQPI
ncbi:FxSxx-COOH system tetratricopeptide repeat protein [Streptomyces sp. NBC_00124]|uniref:FxSxx-COOH system tetratricopeptide repeat protein n=1 Tax=Streptomyces sp. NBC_00124 TaxID=2975662 RepID=UPI002253044E|nr:FxSxx-COOH system tetratricopeptide repeat protein [Streptomyces sp. NBC_00124]MCX5360048.1 FxSxx-COOH system tetratricopeptide repeat protein [Streptomyces sp. NBC_00124]